MDWDNIYERMAVITAPEKAMLKKRAEAFDYTPAPLVCGETSHLCSCDELGVKSIEFEQGTHRWNAILCQECFDSFDYTGRTIIKIRNL